MLSHTPAICLPRLGVPRPGRGACLGAATARQRARAAAAFSVLAAVAVLLIRADAAWTAPSSLGHPHARRPGHGSSPAAARATGTHRRAAFTARPLTARPPNRQATRNGRARGWRPPCAGRAGPGQQSFGGVFDPAAGVTAIYHAHRSFDTASIVKADILAVLLLRNQRAGVALSEEDQELATRMIEDSDNDAASALWDARGWTRVGGRERGAGPARHRARIGRVLGTDHHDRRQRAGPAHGSHLRELAALGLRAPLRAGLDAGRRGRAGWGVSAAATAGTRPAVKNGWLPAGPDGTWVINSIGVIRQGGQRFLVAVLSSGQPSDRPGSARCKPPPGRPYPASPGACWPRTPASIRGGRSFDVRAS